MHQAPNITTMQFGDPHYSGLVWCVFTSRLNSQGSWWERNTRAACVRTYYELDDADKEEIDVDEKERKKNEFYEIDSQ